MPLRLSSRSQAETYILNLPAKVIFFTPVTKLSKEALDGICMLFGQETARNGTHEDSLLWFVHRLQCNGNAN